MPSVVSEKPPRREVIAMLGDAVAAMDALLSDAQRVVGERVMVDGRVVSRRFDSEQRATHGLAWLATYVEAIRQLGHYAQRLADSGGFGGVGGTPGRDGARGSFGRGRGRTCVKHGGGGPL